jgi:hypothetical protein
MKLTSSQLRKIIEEEANKFGDEEDVEKAAAETEEVDADEFADTLDKKIDYVKALKIEEARLIKRIKKIRESKAKVLKTI